MIWAGEVAIQEGIVTSALWGSGGETERFVADPKLHPGNRCILRRTRRVLKGTAPPLMSKVTEFWNWSLVRRLDFHVVVPGRKISPSELTGRGHGRFKDSMVGLFQHTTGPLPTGWLLLPRYISGPPLIGPHRSDWPCPSPPV